ncbi:hypothetical protein [Gallaecimonas mangrovi]|uniref:hypothetical protein n=1 Tax=Gallaecimonas mangrovi TaxID=2291597 RepID=UPI001865AAAA|nr:hypothetical protein [Gallaecimonas mangrovi]
MTLRFPKWLRWALAIGVGLWVSFAIFNGRYERQMIASILNITSVPDSLSVVECESWGLTDVLTTCAVDVNPSDFPKLLSGYNYIESRTDGSSHNVGGGPKVGPEFTVAVEYMVQPKEFTHGGHVMVVADEKRKHAIVDIYVE